MIVVSSFGANQEKRRSLCGIGPMAFVATAQSLTSFPQSLSSSGRFDFHVKLPAPAVAERSAILKHEIQKRSLQCSDDVLLDIASKCDGYDAYDLEILVNRSVHAAIGRYADLSSGETEKPTLVGDDFLQAMQNFLPVAMRDISKPSSEGGRSGWADVGGLNDIRNAIEEMIELPSKFPSIFAQAPLRMRSNVLLYGPPGCGKTHIVGAAAAACSLRFISVKGPELLNKYIGASEQAVRDIFSKAAAAAPCLLFFDEFDSIAPKRGHDNTGVTDRVVNQFLTELDGVEVLTGVFVFAASSRPDLLDAALLRPGRLDRLLFCDFPSQRERLDILAVLSRKLPMASDVDLEAVAYMTEGFSGADLQALLSDTQLEAVHELLDSKEGTTTGKMPVITNALLKSIACKAKPSVSEAEKRRYVRIGNGNQLVRDPKKRTRVLASEKVRWSLRTARLRLARKKKYCQFFTKFGKCNKGDGKCSYIHDSSKIVVCSKFLNGSCSDPDCKLTHKVIPERMQDCSYFLKGSCCKENCPYRHVIVNPNSSVCESFMRGYCAAGNEVLLVLASNFLKLGARRNTPMSVLLLKQRICAEASTCKLHHPKKKTEKKHTSEQKIVRGRYFDGGLIGVPDCEMATSEKLSVKGKEDIVLQEGKYPDYISLDVSDDEVETEPIFPCSSVFLVMRKRKRKVVKGVFILSPMVQKERELVRFENNDAYDDIVSFRKGNKHHNNEFCEHARRMKENDNVDAEFKEFFLCILSKEETFEPHKKRKEKDDVVGEDEDNYIAESDCDPQYLDVLEGLKEYGKSYLLEGEKDGLTIVAKYEEDTSSDSACDLEPRRKLRSDTTKRGYELSDQTPTGVEIKDKNDPKCTSVMNIEKATDVNEVDSDYLSFWRDFKIEDGCGFYKHKDHTIVYWSDGENDLAKEKHDDDTDESSSDVEILEIKEGNFNPSEMNMDSFKNLGSPTMETEFRQRLINILRKPYDREEYYRLLEDFETRKPELRHKDLRGGREISCPTGQEGKSYLDRYPDLKGQLSELKNDKPRCLNLLRGFFFWLQNVFHDGAFIPWQDPECLSINQDSFLDSTYGDCG
ncbi:hypothetical protein RD792_000804 [Penstemon davidsonii]|uniref:C3H1-type domain-containing protein n=1 Tax=Penstemon davidsonii TaxID=160366 RepID=A0ABR0DLX5_9LAMI|nr:hypothetical protein RD792_000804 [Penstemon davidsonii]